MEYAIEKQQCGRCCGNPAKPVVAECHDDSNREQQKGDGVNGQESGSTHLRTEHGTRTLGELRAAPPFLNHMREDRKSGGADKRGSVRVEIGGGQIKKKKKYKN